MTGLNSQYTRNPRCEEMAISSQSFAKRYFVTDFFFNKVKRPNKTRKQVRVEDRTRSKIGTNKFIYSSFVMNRTSPHTQHKELKTLLNKTPTKCTYVYFQLIHLHVSAQNSLLQGAELQNTNNLITIGPKYSHCTSM